LHKKSLVFGRGRQLFYKIEARKRILRYGDEGLNQHHRGKPTADKKTAQLTARKGNSLRPPRPEVWPPARNWSASACAMMLINPFVAGNVNALARLHRKNMLSASPTQGIFSNDFPRIGVEHNYLCRLASSNEKSMMHLIQRNGVLTPAPGSGHVEMT